MPTLADLFRMGRQYVADALPGGSLNPEVTRQGVLDAAAVSTIPVPVLGDLVGLGADVHRYVNEPESRTPGNFALTGLGMLPFVPAMTAWHGSPHKFDKFSLDKIGTGEGAQAYGHGLYLAETPAVAQEYADALGKEVLIKGKPAFRAKDGTMAGDLPVSSGAAGHLRMNDWDLQKAIKDAENTFIDTGDQWFAKVHKELSTLKPEDVQINRGQMYKTDIPDEAVARFLDWDKPLSQQAPEARQAITKFLQEKDPALFKTWSENGALEHAPAGSWVPRTGQSAAEFSSALQQQGIPGIRYLDGGSRSAGQGSSNFVAFDPEMIRILERNGQPTGLQPWKPGEYKLRDLITN